MLALQAAEKCNDDGVKLKMLQILTSLLQSPRYCDNDDAICSALSVCMRIYVASAKAAPAVFSTAAPSIRQAVAMVLDHAVLQDASVAAVHEQAALRLMTDIAAMCAGALQERTGIAERRQVAVMECLTDDATDGLGKAIACSVVPHVRLLLLTRLQAMLRRGSSARPCPVCSAWSCWRAC